jgi:hypothetical protein
VIEIARGYGAFPVPISMSSWKCILSVPDQCTERLRLKVLRKVLIERPSVTPGTEHAVRYLLRTIVFGIWNLAPFRSRYLCE